jgi:hypothetical protein
VFLQVSESTACEDGDVATGLHVKIIYFCRLLCPDDHFLCLRKLFLTTCKNDFASSDIMGRREYK